MKQLFFSLKGLTSLHNWKKFKVYMSIFNLLEDIEKNSKKHQKKILLKVI